MGFEVVVATRQGVNAAYADARGLTITRRLNGSASAGFTVAAADPAARELAVAERVVKVYEDDALRFHGPVWQVTHRSRETVVAARDPWAILERRRIYKTAGNYNDPLVYTATDAGAIAWDLVSRQNSRSATGIRQGAITASVNRDRTFEAGKVVAEAIRQLAEVDDGFWFVLDPVDGVPGVQAELVVRWPDAGADAPGVRFEYGAGTIGNLDDYELTYGLPRNAVVVTGAGEGPARLVSRQEDTTSIGRYGLLEDEVAFSSVILQATLDEHALEELEPVSPVAYAITPVAADPDALGSVYVPRLWHDFDVGDVGRLTIRGDNVTLEAALARIVEATVQVSDTSDAAQLTGLVLEPL